MSSEYLPTQALGVTPRKRAVALRALKGEREFRRVRRLGVNLRTGLFSLKVTDYRPRYGQPWQPAAQIGIVVPKKVLKSAVQRNRVRRRVREALRSLPGSACAQPLPACRGILFPSAEVLRVPFADLQLALAEVMAQVLARVAAQNKQARAKKGRPDRPRQENP